MAWQPLWGCSLRIGYFETLDLTMEEVVDLLDWTSEQRELEWRTAFKKKR